MSNENNVLSKESTSELIDKISEKIKGEMMEEIDKRLKETEETLTDDMSGYVKDHLETQVEEAVEKHIDTEEIKTKKMHKKIKEDLENFQQHLELSHRVWYTFLAISGVMLFWFGAWKVLFAVPVFENGLIPLAVGLIILFITGRVTRSFVS